jgi:peptide/nickel transport system permease protein
MSQAAAAAGGLAPDPPGPGPAGAAEALTTRERSQLRMVTTRFLRHRLAVGSLVLFVLIVAFAFAGPLVYPHGHTLIRGAPPNQAWFENMTHPLGTNTAGNDMLGLLMRGTQQSIKVVFTVAIIAMTLAAVWGTVAGFYRGWVDAVMMRFVDVILIVPLLVLVTALAGNVRGGTKWYPVALVIAAVAWALYARVIRGVVLSLREQEFVEAAKAMGASDARIVFRHLIPNVTGPIIVGATILIAISALTEAALSFLGFGIQQPDTSLGLQIQMGVQAASTRPWLFYPPGIMLVLIALTANFIGDGLRDALDPRQTMVRR